ncbi:glycosyltransferase family 39 protein [Xanthovirga aplysinae]|uniref:glycosyltransferase family 39 protein n=1 Tax=Xanthovirga aplysinae TaxID=2529853 RepID=UPI0012BD148A|nr:glycosyltransferase family 39 protein [Xanthovirga aplysinae]MTI33642.1 glycosyltransferase family 39 protein [Xanthovirga aplysinae]
MKKAVLLLLLFNLLRVLLIPFMGAMPQDAYYHFYGEHLSLSYFDHPPMIAYTLRGFTEIFGKKAYALKLADFVLMFLTQISFYYLASLFLKGKKKFNALLLLGSSGLVLVLSINSTPDVPLFFFWTLTLIALYKAIFEGKKFYWILTGTLMGFSFDSKYTGIGLQLGMIAFLILSKKNRKYLLTPWPYLCLITAHIFMLPVYIWNFNNDFVSFLFQSSQRAESMRKLVPKYFFGLLGTQILLLTPILFFVLSLISFKYIFHTLKRKFNIDQPILFLLCFFLPMFLGFFAISLISWVKLNWIMPAYISGIIFVAYFIKEKAIKATLIFSFIVHLALMVQVLFYPIKVKSNDTWYGWDQLATEVKKIKTAHPNSFIFSDNDYKTSAELIFHLNEKVYAGNIIGKPAKQFDYIGDDLSLLAGKNALYIDARPYFKNEMKGNRLPHDLKPYFEEVRELEPILIKKGEKTVRKFLVYYCKNYHPNNAVKAKFHTE